MMKQILITLILIIPIYCFGNGLCSNIDKLPATSGADELKMYEHQFNYEHAIKSFKYLESTLYDILQSKKTTQSVLYSENFYISYPNTVKFIKGTLLLQKALLDKSQLENLKLSESVKNSEIEKAERVAKESRTTFCDFLSKAEYVD